MLKQQKIVQNQPNRGLETNSGLLAGQSAGVALENVVPLFPNNAVQNRPFWGSLERSDKANVWPNPVCRAWQPGPEYYHPPLYTPQQREIRDKSVWTLVQAVLAPLQFLVFLVSVGLVWRYLATGQGYEIATYSIVAKTLILYVIMITGCIWEKVVFDEWLFADAFFWEDVFSMLVLGLQTLYLCALIFGWWDPKTQVLIALAAYGTYMINAAQFVWKLRQARLQGQTAPKLAEVTP